MTKLFRFLVLGTILAAISGALYAQAPAHAALVYYDNEDELSVLDADGFEYDFLSFGMELRQGDRVVTRSSSAEIQLVPDGSIIRLSDNTDFAIDTILDETTAGNFSLQSGRMRAVTSRNAGSRFNVRTRTAVGGVRGTDFVMEVVPDESDAIFVLEGSVNFEDTRSGDSVTVGANQGANTFADVFAAAEWSEQERNRILTNMNFTGTDPAAVPRQVSAADETVDESEPEPEIEDEPFDTATPIPDEPVEPSPQTDPDPADGPGVLDGMFEFLGGYMGLEIGSVTMGGETYGKVILQPEFEIGRLGLGLYLPIIYQDNLFAPSTWYQPAGNNEWSFGTDGKFSGEEDETWLRIQDFWQDLWLKIRYIRWGEQRDPFFFQVGNLRAMSLGHGILMNRYANDTDFPQVRRVGFNLGLDPGKGGLEIVANDLANPEIFGGRLFSGRRIPPRGLRWG